MKVLELSQSLISMVSCGYGDLEVVVSLGGEDICQ